MRLPVEHILQMVVLFFGTMAVAILMWRPGFSQMSKQAQFHYLLIAVGLALYLIYDFIKNLRRK